MQGVGSFGSNHNEGMAVFVGLVAVLTSIIFFLLELGYLTIPNLRIEDQTYMYFFAGYTLLAGIILLLSTIGIIGVK